MILNHGRIMGSHLRGDRLARRGDGLRVGYRTLPAEVLRVHAGASSLSRSCPGSSRYIEVFSILTLVFGVAMVRCSRREHVDYVAFDFVRAVHLNWSDPLAGRCGSRIRRHTPVHTQDGEDRRVDDEESGSPSAGARRRGEEAEIRALPSAMVILILVTIFMVAGATL